jgi:putative transposase
MSLYKNRYRQNTLRLSNWDYSSPGYYFVTICTKDKQCYFGEINISTIKYSTIGKKTIYLWNQILQHFSHVELDKWILMPNHIHGIIILKERKSIYEDFNKFSKPISCSLSTVINQFKASVTRWCNQNDFKHFSWQKSFYEHIIRSEASLASIREYIANNPIKWELDEYYQ